MADAVPGSRSEAFAPREPSAAELDGRAAEHAVRLLLKLSDTLHASLDLGTLLDALAQETVALVGACGGYAGWRSDSGMVSHRYFRPEGPLEIELAWAPGEPGLAGWLLEHRVPYLTNDAAADPLFPAGLRERLGVVSALAVPIVTLDLRVLGFFEVHNKPGGFTPADVELLQAVARIAAIAMQNALVHRESERTHEALEQSEQRFRFLAEMMPSIAWTAAPDGTITYANRRWLDFCGPAASPSHGGWPELEVHPEDRTRHMLEWNLALREGLEYEVEVRHRRHDGEYRWFISRAVPMKDSAGRVIAWFGLTTDIDDLKRAQQQLRESDRRKDEFLATLAHELRNPLAPLSLAAQMLAANPQLDARAAEMLSVLQRQVDHMVRLIDDLMEVSRISRGKIELRRANVDLHSILHNSVELARPHIEGAQHHLEISLPERPVQLNADPVRLAQIVANLLNNAAKYTPEGGTITLSAQDVGSEVVIRVRDNGAGISPEALPHIFDLFGQGDRGPLHTRGGLGIGLSLARALTELHGGRIGVHSDGLGFGSEFTLRLPLGGAAQPAGPKRPMPEALREAKGVRVLVVDDNKAAATMLGLALETLGASVRVVFDGNSAVSAVSEFQPDIVFMDIGMPGVDGHEAARRIRASAGAADTLLVAVSGWGQPEMRARSTAAGFDHHLVKPVELAQLKQLLAERLSA